MGCLARAMDVLGYIYRYKEEQAQSINISKRPSKIYLHKSKYKYKYNYTYINLKIKCSITPNIDKYVRKPMHVSGLLITLWEAPNSLFVRNKYVTPTGKWLHAGYVQKAEARKT